MNAFECAFESWGSILFNQKNFRVVEYSQTNLQTKICNMSILANLRKNTKSSVQKRGRWVIAYIFFSKRFMMILSENIFDGTQKISLFSNFGLEWWKFNFFNSKKSQSWNGCKKSMKHSKINSNTVLESQNIILFDFIYLGTTMGTILQLMKIKKP